MTRAPPHSRTPASARKGPPDDASAATPLSPDDVIRAEFVASAATQASLPPPALPEIAFAGRSNVGKSSMMNALMQRHGLVRTSSTPGCTRSVNVFQASDRTGLNVHLVDLPGYGFAKRSKHERLQWGPMLEDYLLGRVTLRGVVLIVDARRGVEDDDRALLDFFASRHHRSGIPQGRCLVAATKCDLLPKSKRKPTLAAVASSAGRPVIGFSAVLGEGRVEIWRWLRKTALGDWGLPGDSPPATPPAHEALLDSSQAPPPRPLGRGEL